MRLAAVLAALPFSLLAACGPSAAPGQVHAESGNLLAPPVRQYRAVDLTAQGNTGSWAASVAQGQQAGKAGKLVQGVSGSSVADHAAIWSGDASTFLDLHPAGSYSASRIAGTSGGQQAGTADATASGPQAFVWAGSAASAVSLHPFNFQKSRALGTDGVSQVGDGTNAFTNCRHGGCTTITTTHALLWSGSAASVVDLTPSTGGTSSSAVAVQGGLQAGNLANHAAIWSGTAASLVDLHPAAYGASGALGTWNGQQVGFATVTSPVFQSHAVLWSGSAASALDLHPDGFDSSRATAISAAGQVGHGSGPSTGGHVHALLWNGSAQSAADLNQFLPAGYTDAFATGIDDAGNVVGAASSGSPDVATGSNLHAILWVPVVLPGPSLAALALSVGTAMSTQPITGTVTLSAAAPAGGAAVALSAIALTRAVPAAVSLPASVAVPAGQTSATFTLSVSAGASCDFVFQGASSGLTQSATLTVIPEVLLAAVRVGNVQGGQTGGGSVWLNNPAPADGAVVMLASSNALLATLPTSVSVAAGQSTASFSFPTGQVGADTALQVTATYQTFEVSTAQTSFTVLAPQPLLVAAITGPASLSASGAGTYSVVMNQPAAAGAVVSLSSDAQLLLSVPGSVTIPAGAASALFTAQAAASGGSATLTATYAASTTSIASLTVTVVSQDQLAIQKAVYTLSNRTLTVQATSSSATAALTVLDGSTHQVIGVLTNKGPATDPALPPGLTAFAGIFALASAPQGIVVSSSQGGTASAAVISK